MEFNFTLEDLIIAYRKAKSSIYFENGHDHLIQFANYESNLLENLEKLKDAINGNQTKFLFSSKFLGGFQYVFKDMKFDDEHFNENQKEFIYESDQIENWKRKKVTDISFRFIGDNSVDFQIISSLWIDKVGVFLDNKLSESCYGSRIRKPKQSFKKLRVDEDELKKNASHFKFINGHFRPYYWDYKRWHEDGIAAIEKSLENKKSVAVLTADVKHFYHSVTPNFLLDHSFLEFIGFNGFTSEQFRLTKLIVELINHWSELNFKKMKLESVQERMHCGLPVGLSASRVIANLFLAYWDKMIEEEIKPIHYGRYVDDIILVIEKNDNIQSGKNIWEFLEKRINEISYSKSWQNKSDESENIDKIKLSGKYISPFAEKCEIEFGCDKEKVFLLDGTSGNTFIKSLRETLHENSSEWRLLPDSNEEIEELSKELTSPSSTVDESVNSLRKSDGLSVQRLKFALRLRNFESLVNIVPKESWKEEIDNYFKLCYDLIFIPQQLRTYLSYYPRIIGLAVRAKEFSTANKLQDRLKECLALVQDKIEDFKEKDEKGFILKHAVQFNQRLIEEAIAANLDPFDKSVLNFKEDERFEKRKLKEYLHEARILFMTDLHSKPFKNLFFEQESKDVSETFLFQETYSHYLDLVSVLNHFSENLSNSRFDFAPFLKKIEQSSLEEQLPNGLFLVTRPFDVLELTLLLPNWCNNQVEKNDFNDVLKSFCIPAINCEVVEVGKKINQIKLTSGNKNNNPVVALTSFLTKEESWVSLVREDGYEPDFDRVNRLFKLINDILKCNKVKIDYVVFPELSMQRQQIHYVAKKLKSKNISLITGLEYKINSDEVSNQLLYVLNTERENYNSQIAIIQEKVIPAFHEENELLNIGGKWLKAKSEKKYIIQHNNVFFSGLICNELLNIDYRQPLRGEIDILFVVEWNKDVEMYDHIVSSTSNDLHSFVVQVNNREYGDTRLRGPYKESFDRDKVRVRGGELDYFVVSTIEIKEIREFQKNHRSPEKPFKPVPTGFRMSSERRRIDNPKTD